MAKKTRKRRGTDKGGEQISRVPKVRIARPKGRPIQLRFSPGRIGIIASVTRPFCGACSRLRVTADGKVRPCLFSLEEWDLRPLLRSGANDEELAAFVVDAVWTKQKGHTINAADFVQPERTMSAIGG